MALAHPSAPPADAVVLGAGPAGAGAAALLARHGHDTLLVRPPAPPAPALGESIPPSARPLLDEVGALAAVEAAAFHANRGNVVRWAGRPPRVETFAEDARGYHLTRAGLEDALVAAARAAGAEVLEGATARSATRDGDGWRIRCALSGRRAVELRARWLLDATGRRGVVARETRIPDRSASTLALVRAYRRPGGWGEELADRTLVESHAKGWAWSVPLSGDVRCACAMVEGRPRDLPRSSLTAAFEAAIGRAPHLASLLRGTVPGGEAWACPATPYTSSRFARPGLVLVGDAGSFIDPLSSYGVKKALASGWLASVVVHTGLLDPAASGLATGHFDAREREVYRSWRALSARFFEEAAEAYGRPYWIRRAEAARKAAEGHPAEGAGAEGWGALGGEGPAAGPPMPEAAVRAAHERIRARPRLDAAPGRTLRAVKGSLVRDHRVVPDERPASDAVPGGIRFVRGVDLAALVRLAPGHAEVPELWTAYNRAAAPVPLPDFLTALAAAFAAGLLEHREG